METNTQAGRMERAEISRMFDALVIRRGRTARIWDTEAAERLRDYPGSYFPARMRAEAALKAWREKYPEAAAAEDSERVAYRAKEESRKQKEYESSFIGRGLD
jgi:hypothetical protein